MAEENRDGANDDRSRYCGAEDPSSDPSVDKLRKRVEARSVVVLYAPGVLSWPGGNRTPKQEQ
jgi:hypothetical protein